MEEQHGFQPQNFEPKAPFSQGGFQPADQAFSQGGFQTSSEGFSQSGFQPTSGDFSQTGFLPSNETKQGNSGFQPQGHQEVRVDVADLVALREAIDRGRESLVAAEELLKKLEFLPAINKE